MADRLSLAQAALRLGCTYDQVRRMVLRGELAGGQDEAGRWYVVAEAIAPGERNGKTAA